MASFDAHGKTDLSESESTTLIRADGRLSTVRIILIGLPGHGLIRLTVPSQSPLSRDTSREKCKTCSLRSLCWHLNDVRAFPVTMKAWFCFSAAVASSLVTIN
jgi:hypothetical protein